MWHMNRTNYLRRSHADTHSKRVPQLAKNKTRMNQQRDTCRRSQVSRPQCKYSEQLTTVHHRCPSGWEPWSNLLDISPHFQPRLLQKLFVMAVWGQGEGLGMSAGQQSLSWSCTSDELRLWDSMRSLRFWKCCYFHGNVWKEAVQYESSSWMHCQSSQSIDCS